MNLHPDSTTKPSRRWITIVACVLLCAIAFGVGALFSKMISSRLDSYIVVEEENGINTDATTESAENSTQEMDTQEGEVDEEAQALADAGAAELGQVEMLNIDWIAPEDQPEVPFDSKLYSVLCSVGSVHEEFFGSDGSEVSPCMSWQNPIPDARAFRLGTVRGGEYDEYYLEMNTALQPGMGEYWESYYLLRNPLPETNPVLLSTVARSPSWMGTNALNSTAPEMLGEERFAKLRDLGCEMETSFSIREFGFDVRVIDTKGRAYRFIGFGRRFDAPGEPGAHLDTYTLSTRITDGRELKYQNIDDPESLKDASGEVQPSNRFVMLDEDGRVLNYGLELSFWDYETDVEYGQKPPHITWDDGTENSMIYFKGQVGGCGFVTELNVLSDEIVQGLPEMARVGTGVGKDGSKTPMFEPVTYDHPYYAEGFNALSKMFWDNEKVEKTFADFEHPYLYFQDSFGRWVEMVSIEMIPPVECGKPVIYLYPESPTDLIVEVKPQGGFTFTEPAYHDGWRVTAYPDGTIVNRDDGKEYPYLFWEGRGGMYSPPTSYWVVEREGVEKFLRNKLLNMGLIENEINDFVEFWLPRMQSAPYYKIGFHDTRVMDKLAPLNFSVAPDHIFRILMDYSELSSPIPSKPPTHLPRADRTGFEVIEWGGVIR